MLAGTRDVAPCPQRLCLNWTSVLKWKLLGTHHFCKAKARQRTYNLPQLRCNSVYEGLMWYCKGLAMQLVNKGCEVWTLNRERRWVLWYSNRCSRGHLNAPFWSDERGWASLLHETCSHLATACLKNWTPRACLVRISWVLWELLETTARQNCTISFLVERLVASHLAPSADPP